VKIHGILQKWRERVSTQKESNALFSHTKWNPWTRFLLVKKRLCVRSGLGKSKDTQSQCIRKKERKKVKSSLLREEKISTSASPDPASSPSVSKSENGNSPASPPELLCIRQKGFSADPHDEKSVKAKEKAEDSLQAAEPEGAQRNKRIGSVSTLTVVINNTTLIRILHFFVKNWETLSAAETKFLGFPLWSSEIFNLKAGITLDHAHVFSSLSTSHFHRFNILICLNYIKILSDAQNFV